VDYGNKHGGLSEPYQLTGDVKKDMDRLRAFYAGMKGHRPELMSDRRLREEDEPSRLLSP